MGLLDNDTAIHQDAAGEKKSEARSPKPEKDRSTKNRVIAELRAVALKAPEATKDALKVLVESLVSHAMTAAKDGKKLKLRKLTKKLGGKKMVKMLDQTLAQVVKDKKSKKLIRKLVGKKQLRKIGAKKLAKKVA